ncbi:MAG: secretin and TonB N-terminal domain-containing protein, partial [Deltaproteobacteria bacterium]|nr:secretin and TonB N-terminal domain-containing protein [Deltaproteobacteria bacterium]
EDELEGLKIAINELKKKESEKGTKSAESLNNLETELIKKENAVLSLKTEYEKSLMNEKKIRIEKEEEVRGLSKKVKELEKEIADKEQNRTKNEANLKKMKEDLAKKEYELKQIKAEMAKKPAGGDTMKSVLAEKETEVKKLKNILKEAIEREKSDKKEIEKYAKKLNEVNKVLIIREGEISALKDRYDETQKKLHNVSKENKHAESKIKDLESRLDERDQTIEKLNALYLANQAAKKEMEAGKTAKLMKDSENLLKESEKLQKELVKAKKEREELLTQLNEEKTASRDFTKEKEKLEGELSSLKTALTESESSLKEQQAKFGEQIAVYEKELKENRDKIKQLTAMKEKEAAAVQKAKALIKNIDFKDSGDASKVIIKTAAEIPNFEVRQEGKSFVTLSLKNAAIPKNLERKLDVSEFDSQVTAISSFAAGDEDRNVNILAEIKPGTNNRVYIEGANIVWEFSGKKEYAMASQKTVPLITESVKPKMIALAGEVPEPKSSTIEMPTIKKEMGEQGYLNPQDILKSKKKKYKGKKINLTVKDAEIQHVLTFLAKEGKVNIVTSEDVAGKVTFHLENIPWDLALDTILKTKGLDYVVEQGIYRVAPIERIQKEFELEVEKKKKIVELKAVAVHLVPLNYAIAKEIASKVDEVLSSKGVVEVDERTNTLIIKDTEDYIAVAEELIKRLDTQTPQVLIEARIVEARTTFKEDIGVQWGGNFAMASVYGNETGLIFPSNIGIAGGAS